MNTVCPPAIQELAKEAGAKGKTFVLSLSAPFILYTQKEHIDATLPYIDFIIGNDTEVAAFGEVYNAGTKDLKAIAKHMANQPKENSQRKRVAIVTQGTKPTLVAVQGEDEVKEFPVHVIAKDDINDTTGAGDAFAGGFLAGIIESKPLDQCIDMGQWLARLTLSGVGASYVLTIPSRAPPFEVPYQR